jgi:hypothetical protein
MTKEEIKNQIWECVQKSYELIYKLQFSAEHAVEVNELKESTIFKQIVRIATKKSVYKSLKKDYLEKMLNEAMGILHNLELSQKEVITYEANGIEFIEHEEFVGVSLVKPNADFKAFLQVVYHTFHKPVSFMVNKHNDIEVAIMNKWGLPVVEDLDCYHKCIMDLDYQKKII